MTEAPAEGDVPSRTVSVVVADDDSLVRVALTQLIDESPGLSVLGSAADADAALDLIDTHQPDIAVVDFGMPGGGGPRIASESSLRSPSTRVIALSARSDRSARRAMERAGASRYLVKGHPDTDVIAAIRDVAAAPAR